MIYVLITSFIIIIILFVATLTYRKKANIQIEANRQQIIINNQLEKEGEQLKQQNKEIKQQIEQEEKHLFGIKTTVEAQQNIFKSISATNEIIKEQGKKQAEEVYQAKMEALAVDYEQKEQEYKQKYEQVIAILNRSILEEKDKLEDLEAKQQAYFEAQKRAQEIEEQKDYYRLILSDFDLSDILLLRELQKKFTRKDVIDKMIWETYYRPAFDALTGRIFPNEKISGIYKITSLLTNQSYIGQSVDIKERIRQHIKTGLSCSIATNKLYQEMYKQGPENFTYEILEKVPKEKLNERETYWIEFYKTKEIGLNVTRGGA